MKRVLITGANSYVGTNVEKWLMKEPDKFYVETLDMKNPNWREFDFSKFDVVFHVAGIAHIKETKKNKDLYYKINRDLAFELGKKARESGVTHFIFMSSMSVYGLETGVISQETILNPKSNYGKSKMQAEDLLISLNNESFKIAILRPPLIYGKGCRGNYRKVVNYSLKFPIFPNVQNFRSMIYIDNLSEFVMQLIKHQSEGLFMPQNENYVTTSELVRFISEAHGKRMILLKNFDFLIKILRFNIVKRIFGDLVYEKRMSNYGFNYNLVDFYTSVINSESEEKS